MEMIAWVLLFFAAFVAAATSGAAGFGGALLLLPLLVATVGSEQAVPLLTLAQLVGNLSRVGLGFAQIRWRPVGLFLCGAIPCSLLGAASFVRFPSAVIVRCIGAAILLFLILRHLGRLRITPGPGWLVIGGGVTGFLSGLVGSAGPLGAAIFLALGLPPVAYIASEATTALAMHGAKSVLYLQSLSFEPGFWWLAAGMSLAMLLGTWAAKRIIEHLPRERFQGYVSLLLAMLAVYMLIHG
jgi:uncharacterized protein